MRKKTVLFLNIVYALFLGLLTGMGITAIILAVGRYAWLRSLLDRLSPDGSFDRFTPDLYTNLRIPAAVLGLLFVGLLLLFFFRKSLWNDLLRWLGEQARSFKRDTRDLFYTVRQRLSRADLWLDGLLLFFLAALLRFMWLESPLQHDEAFTYYVFARLPWRYVIADYSYPNNHILHTLLLKACVLLFGNHSWAMRLPAYVFGSMIAPLVYAFARYSTSRRWTAFLAGGLAVVYPYMIQFSVNARGYSMMAVFTLLGALLAMAAMRHKNRMLWLLFSLIMIAGLYTLPIMMLPAGGLFMWMLLNGLMNGFSSAYGRWGWLKYMIAAGVLMVTVTVLLYLPVVQYSGYSTLVDNPNVAPLSHWEFLPTLSDRLKDIWRDWQAGLPLWLTLPAVLLAAAGSLFYGRKSSTRASIFLSMLLFLAAYSVLRRPNLWPRIVYYLIPLLMLGLAFGLAGIWQWITGRRRGFSLPGWLVPVGVSMVCLGILLHTPNYSPLGQRLKGDTELLAELLSSRWQDDTIILIEYPEDMPFYVYMERLGLPASAVRWEQPFRGAYVIVNKTEKQSIPGVIKQHGPELAFFDLEKAELLEDYPTSSLYYVPSHWDLVQKEYAIAAGQP